MFKEKKLRNEKNGRETKGEKREFFGEKGTNLRKTRLKIYWPLSRMGKKKYYHPPTKSIEAPLKY